MQKRLKNGIRTMYRDKSYPKYSYCCSFGLRPEIRVLFVFIMMSVVFSTDALEIALKEFRASSTEQAVALMLHGLNFNPEKMQPLAEVLTGMGITVFTIALTGHRSDPDAFKQVTRELWLEEALSAFRQTHAYADPKRLPVLFIGFSLGAVVGMDAAGISMSPLFQYAILFSPALAARDFSSYVKIFYGMGNGYVVPSMAPEKYRANPGTTVAAYKALFAHMESFGNSEPARINFPVLCFIDPGDELVDIKKITRLIETKQLNAWKIVSIRKDRKTAREVYHHLTIDSNSVGSATWEMIVEEMGSFLQSMGITR